MPEPLRKALRSDAAAKRAFDSMSAGRQREYAQFVADAKRDDTKLRRVEKSLALIRTGVGLNDKYR